MDNANSVRYAAKQVNREESVIEMEVVEIDGVAIERQPNVESQRQASWNDWSRWQGRVKKIDLRWWPLWLLLGAVLFVLAIFIGLFVAIFLVIYRIIKFFLVGIMSVFAPPEEVRKH